MEVSPSGTWLRQKFPEPFDLRWAAWGAAVETLQIDLVAAGWMNLFAALLVPAPASELRWRGAGPGRNAEVKRAYSALFGRFFGRGVLRRDHGCRWLRQVQDGLELAPGVHLRRRAGCAGDLPDWVGWDDINQCIVVAEAKGSHDRGSWCSTSPAPLRTALAQLDRVEIVDSLGTIHFKTWAVACRWGTVENRSVPTIITCDPEAKGRFLEPDEAQWLREEIRARWTADLLEGLGRPDVANSVRAKDQGIDMQGLGVDLVMIPGRKGYGALAVDTGGITPLVGAARGAQARALIETARGLKRHAALILLDVHEAECAMRRVRWDWTDAPQLEAVSEVPGDVTVDGVTFLPISDHPDFLGEITSDGLAPA
jgi:hypothetical protein